MTRASGGSHAVTPRRVWGSRICDDNIDGFQFAASSVVSVSVHVSLPVFATYARHSDVLSMRSSGRKRSPCRNPFAEHDARNFVTSEVRSLLSSHVSIHTFDPGRNWCHESTNESIEQTLVFRSSPRAVTKGYWNDSLAQDMAIPQSLCEQSSLSLFALPLPY